MGFDHLSNRAGQFFRQLVSKIIGGHHPVLSALSNQWKESLTWLGFAVLGGCVPVWGGMVLFKLFSLSVSFADFSGNGEFALYSASLLAPALYLVVKNFKTTSFAYRPLFTLGCFGGLGLALVLFAGVTVTNTLARDKIKIPLNISFLSEVTIGLFVLSALTAFVVTALDNERTTLPDLREQQQEDINKLGQQVDNLRSQK